MLAVVGEQRARGEGAEDGGGRFGGDEGGWGGAEEEGVGCVEEEGEEEGVEGGEEGAVCGWWLVWVGSSFIFILFLLVGVGEEADGLGGEVGDGGGLRDALLDVVHCESCGGVGSWWWVLL